MNIAVNVNGQITDAEHATVSALDRGFLFGEGVYETLRTYNRRPFLLNRHLDRLRGSASHLSLTVPLDDVGYAERIAETVSAVSDKETELYIRLLVTRGVGDLTYDPNSCPDSTVVIIVRPYAGASTELDEKGITVVRSSIVRNHPAALNPIIKSNNLLNNALAMQEAIKAGADEALMLDPHGFVATCNSTHFFIVRQGEVWTSTGDYCLPGITRGNIVALCRENDIPVFEKNFSLTEVYCAEEAFVTGTFGGLSPVASVDGRTLGPGKLGPMTMQLRELYRNLIEQDCA